jgi:ergothioneine biosynthesis protein EgtB
MHNENPTMPQSSSSVEQLISRFLLSRAQSTDFIKELSPEDCQPQSMDDASPTKWHLAHVTWFYEVMVLQQFEANFKFWRPPYAVLFNSYYNSVGDKHPRPKRGLLTRPSLDEVMEWRHNIDTRVVELLKTSPSVTVKGLIEIGINHEQQHQELMKTDLQHLFFSNSLYPHVSIDTARPEAMKSDFHWVKCPSGIQTVGYDGLDFHFDNESPTHKVYLSPCLIRNTLVSNAEWMAFIDDGGYQQSKFWLDEGWAWRQREHINHPLYWVKDERDAKYQQFSLSGLRPLKENEPVRNISYFEAEAFARWASISLKDHENSRLPTEFEWESTAANEAHQLKDLFGEVWQWTSSHYGAYPGYRAWSGLAGEYNGKFMVNQYVLKGSSAFTSAGHARITYRNFFPTHARWQMTGLRLAKDSA